MLLLLGVRWSIRGAFSSPSASRNRSDAKGSPGVQPPPPAVQIHSSSTNSPKMPLFWPAGMPEPVIKGFSQHRPRSPASFTANFPRASLGRAGIRPGMRSRVKNLERAAFIFGFWLKSCSFTLSKRWFISRGLFECCGLTPSPKRGIGAAQCGVEQKLGIEASR